ncbi:MAG TPA: metallophosphoesterase [Anaerolineales bacterium]|nr:metallophosphoesterase [Anaerolineales bacterium]
MKIALLSDIHGNLRALETVLAHIERWKPEHVIVAGDVVNRGPCSRACLQLVLERVQHHGWQFLRGNHEDYLLHAASPEFPTHPPASEYLRLPSWSCHQDVRELVHTLADLPYQTSLTAPNGGLLTVVHGSMQGTRIGVYPETDNEKLTPLVAKGVQVFACAHTHRAFQRFFLQDKQSTLIVNIGSVGLPFDGDTRAGYAQLTWQAGRWSARLIRLEYDMAQAERDFATTGYLVGGGALAQVVLRELQLAVPMLSSFDSRFSKAILSSEISVEQAVKIWLAQYPDSFS